MNFDKYIGLPYQENGRTVSGLDCWGLARLFYKQELNLELPDYSDLYSGSWDEQVTKLINYHKDSWYEVAKPELGDLCLFNIYNEPAHIGVYVGDSKFLHARDGQDSVIESLNNPIWKRRVAGYFKYKQSSSEISVTGAPHPLRIQKLTDWTAAGTTITDLVKFIHHKYQISEKLSKRLVLMVDGVPISEDKWSTTVLREGQQVSYRTLAQGGSSGRMFLMFAIMVAAVWIAGPTGLDLGAKVAGATGLTVAQGTAIAVAGVQMAGMALVNAIAPIRPPESKNPGQPNQLNLFNGASNQANRLGAIPVVLGKVRYVGMLGATPYIETHTTTNILNMLIIWGFGPLDVQDLCVGANNLDKAYYEDFPVETPRPITLYGSPAETAVEVERFNRLYPTDVEQIFKNVELTNNPTDGNPWQEITFVQEATSIDIAFNFPEGMRRIKTKGNGAGDVTEANCSVEVQIAKVGDPFTNTPALNPGSGDSSVAAYSKTFIGSSIAYSDGIESTYNLRLYRWYDICIGPGGAITEFAGAATQDPLQEPNQQLIDSYRSGAYNSLLDINGTYSRLPQIPAGYTRLYRICTGSGQGLLSQYTVNYLQGQSNYFGLALTYTNVETGGWDESGTPLLTGDVNVNISGGSYYPSIAPTSNSVGTQTIFETNPLTVPNTIEPSQYSGWSDLLKSNGVWGSSGTTFDRSVQVTLPQSGVYDFEASVDDTANITFGGRQIFQLPKDSWSSIATQSEYFEAGTYTLRMQATDTGGKQAVAVKITYTPNSGSNVPASPKGIFTVGTSGNFYKRKDPFNYVYRVRELSRARYKLRVRRLDQEFVEDENSEYRYLNKVVVGNAVCFDNKLPMMDLPRGRLARTAIKVQSTSKANGQVDGINALLQTKAYDWDRATNTWTFRATNNPASLFLYVLTHPANAYRIADIESPTIYSEVKDRVDLDKIIEWHNFCNPQSPTDNNPVLTYNNVLTSTQSVMDTLRDICAAGKASPIFVDGKWSVIIDKPRNHVIQHFTPHNSWGFESTKILPKIPHAFRVTIQDEENAYQAKEVYAYNYGYNMYGTGGKQAAEIFEELSLPGITNTRQALHLARWHLAQLKLRPEIYTINTDFEYLVCNRGDLVRVTHDVPLWGIGSGRIRSINTGTKIIQLTEQVLLEANPSPQTNYKIRIRTNDISTTAGSGSVYLTLQRITTTGYYDTITVVENIPNNVEVDNLFMLGKENLETQELVVLSVEPSQNLVARITLVDYSPQIYTADLANDLLSYNPSTTLPSGGVVENTIVGVPVIRSIISTRDSSLQLSTGIYETTALLTFENPSDLSKNAERVQFEMIRSDQTFNASSPSTFYFATKESGNITFAALETAQMYKVRARYTNNAGSIFGSWSTAQYFVAGPSGLQPATPTLAMDLEDIYIVARVPQTFVKSADFLTFEYRIYKDTGVEDFWEITPDGTNNIKIIQSTAEARFNLLDQSTPRISQQGVTYRVACRALNRNGEYSTQSALGTLVVTTIT